MVGIDGEHRQIQEGVAQDHRLHEPKVLPQAADERGEPPHPRALAAAVEADLVVDPHQLAAGGAEDGAGALAAEHGGTLSQRINLRGSTSETHLPGRLSWIGIAADRLVLRSLPGIVDRRLLRRSLGPVLRLLTLRIIGGLAGIAVAAGVEGVHG